MENRLIRVSIIHEMDDDEFARADGADLPDGIVEQSRGEVLCFDDTMPRLAIYVYETVLPAVLSGLLTNFLSDKLLKRKCKKATIEVETELIQLNLEREEWKDDLGGFIRETVSAKIKRSKGRR